MAKKISPEQQFKSFCDLIRNDPLNPKHYSALAKWLDSQEDPRADAVRLGIIRRKLMHETPEPYSYDPEFSMIEDAHVEMNHQFGKQWKRELPKCKGVKFFPFDGGLIDQVGFNGKVSDFANHLEAIFATTPVNSFDPPYEASQAKLEAMLAIPQFAELEALILGDEHHKHIANAIVASPHLDRLKLLWLRNNRLIDSSVEALAGASHLKTVKSLSLTDNRDLTEVSIRAIGDSPHFKNLQELKIESVNFSKEGGKLFAGAKYFKRLRRLEMPYVELSVEGWKAIVDSGKLNGIRFLDLRSNDLPSSSMEYFFKQNDLSKLRTLSHFARNKELLCEIKTFHQTDLSSLQYLRMDRLTNSAVASLAKSKWTSGLRKLKISCCPDAKSVKTTLKNADFSKLEVLHLESFPESVLISLAENPTLKKLKVLEILSDSLSKKGKQKILEGAWIKRLDYLGFSGEASDDSFLELVAQSQNLKQLRYLRAGTSAKIRREAENLTDKGIISLCQAENLPNLESLRLPSEKLSDESVLAICQAKLAENLKILRGSGEKLTNKSIVAIAESLPNLNQLELPFSNFTNPGFEKLMKSKHISKMHKLYIGDDKLSQQNTRKLYNFSSFFLC